MRMSGARWTALGLLLAAVATFWQAQSLPRWSFDGPGTGIFPLVLSTIAIALSVLGLNLLGDGLRDALDPRLSRRM